jgi:APA family basic amino acid/polyamine antiporter
MLNRTLTLTDLTLFGVASSMGSGGFNLIGSGVRQGGAMWPWALGISAALLLGSAFTYAGAYERIKKNTSESDILRSVFGPLVEGAGSYTILIYDITTIIVLLVMCSKLLIPSYSWSCQVSLTLCMLAGMTGFALFGIDANRDVINGLTWSLVGVLVIAVALGGYGVATREIPTLGMPTHAGFMQSLWMFFFILVGFNTIMKFSEETKVESDIPKAFYLSNAVSVILTIGVAVAITMWLPALTLGQEGIAFELLFAKFFGNGVLEPLKWMVVIFLLLTAFVIFLATSRYLYGLDWLPALKEVNSANAPWVSIAAVFGSGSLLTLLNNVDLLVKFADIGFAVIATLVASAVSVADWRDGHLGSAIISGATGAGFMGLIGSAFL